MFQIVDFCILSFVRFLQKFKIGLILKISLGIETTYLPGDIMRESSAFDGKIGPTIAANLQKTYPDDSAIHRILPNCSLYLSPLTTSRE